MDFKERLRPLIITELIKSGIAAATFIAAATIMLRQMSAYTGIYGMGMAFAVCSLIYIINIWHLSKGLYCLLKTDSSIMSAYDQYGTILRLTEKMNESFTLNTKKKGFILKREIEDKLYHIAVQTTKPL